jgi:hypothetical protein
VLTSVLLLTEGVDVPRCRTALLARPTESPILLQQMIGRAMRGPKVGGSETCNVVDFVDNFERGLDFSASAIGFIRDFEPAVQRLIKRPLRPEQKGVGLALLLRLREYVNRRLAEPSEPSLQQIWNQGVAGWVECWDGHGQRALVWTRASEREILDAFRQVRAAVDRAGGDPEEWDVMERARAVHHALDLARHHVAEEDFVAIMAARANPDPATTLAYHSLEDVRMDPEGAAAVTRALGEVVQALSGEPGLSRDLAPVVAMMRTVFGGPLARDRGWACACGSYNPPANTYCVACGAHR